MNNIDEIFKVSQLISKETLDDLKDHEREFLQSWKQSGDNHKVYQEIRNEFAFIVVIKKFSSWIQQRHGKPLYVEWMIKSWAILPAKEKWFGLFLRLRPCY